jgi:hypothetical protein
VGCLIADDFEFYPIGKPDLASQARRAYGLIGGVATCRVGQQKIFLGIDIVEQRFLAAVKIHPAHGYGHHFRTASFQRPCGFLKRLVLSRAYD